MRGFVVCLILSTLLLAGCQGEVEKKSEAVLSVGMLLGKGGLGDRSFNDSAYAGLQEAGKEQDVRIGLVEYANPEKNVEAVSRLVDDGYDLIIALGYENRGAIQTLAEAYPETRFGIIDIFIEGRRNVSSVIFREQEGDFLMGVMAAKLTKTGKLGFIGGMDIPVITRIQGGFIQGAQHVYPGIDILSDMAGTFADPEIGRKLALAQYEAGIDIIYNAAGRTGLGIIDAAKEADRYVLGTSGDHRHLAPGNVLGNRPKNVGIAVQSLIDATRKGDDFGKVISLGLKEGGISVGPFAEGVLTQELRTVIMELRNNIVSGEIVVE